MFLMCTCFRQYSKIPANMRTHPIASLLKAIFGSWQSTTRNFSYKCSFRKFIVRFWFEWKTFLEQTSGIVYLSNLFRFLMKILTFSFLFLFFLLFLFFRRQIENDCENDTVFECNKTSVSRRSSATTNNNNQVLGEPVSPKTVRSR